MIDVPFGKTVTILRNAVIGRDPKTGDDIYGPVNVQVEGVVTWLFNSAKLTDEITTGQDTTLNSIAALFPDGTQISAVDQVEVDGLTYEVVSVPFAWQSPFSGTTAGVQVQLQRVTG